MTSGLKHSWNSEVLKNHTKCGIFMPPVFDWWFLTIADKNNRLVYISDERLKHIKRHPHMHDPLDNISATLMNPAAICYFSDDESVLYFYKEFKNNLSSERYLLVAVKYLNRNGFVITSFFTNRIKGIRWKAN